MRGHSVDTNMILSTDPPDRRLHWDKSQPVQLSREVALLAIITFILYKMLTPVTMKGILSSGPLKTKLIIINYNDHDD